MCQAIKFRINNHSIVFNYQDSKPCLPLITPDGHIKIIPWGPLKDSGPPPYPACSTAHIRDVRTEWRQFQPHSTRIGCEAFLMRDSAGNEKWFEVPCEYISGVVVTFFGDHRAYILMRQRDLIDPPGHHEWPIYVQR